MDLQLENRVAIVTGAGVGIGLGIAHALAQEGVRVVLAGRREELLRKAAAELAQRASSAHLVVPVDLAELGAGTKLARQVEAAVGQVDIVINNAGVSQPLSTEGSDAEWDAAYSLRFREVRHLIEALLPGMKRRRFGRIINVGGSWEVQDVINSASVMNAARAVYSKSLSREVGGHGITVNTIGPGVIVSEQIDKIFPSSAAREAFVNANVPAGYFGEPRDLAVMAVFLASPLARYITGEVIAVDGGMHRFGF